MTTEIQTMPAAMEASSPGVPQLTILTRVASIPLINDSLQAVHSTLTNNAYTKMPYSKAQALTSYAFQVTEPIQVRLAPVIQRADGLANKAVDVVENRYPYPFHVSTKEVYGTLKAHSEHAYGVANKTIDDKVRQPAYGIVQGIDQIFAKPVVDRFAYVVSSIHAKQTGVDGAPGPDAPAPEPPKEEFQYKRAYRLSMDLKDSLLVLTNDQIKQIQEHNIIVQRAAATAHNITQAVSSSVELASQKVHQLSDAMLTELHSLQSSAAAIPSTLQTSLGLNGLQERLSPVIGEVKEVLTSEQPVKEKLTGLKKVVEERVKPILEGATARVSGTVNAIRAKAVEAAGGKKPTENGVNGINPETLDLPTVNGDT